jgi:subtilisin family serine protease
MPFTTGLAALIAVLGVLGSTPAYGAVTPAAWGNARGQEWWLTDLHVTQAWRTSEGAGVIVAVLGTGVAADHPDLAGNVITGPDYTGSDRAPGSPYWGVEGTAVAGIVAGHGHGGNWNIGIVGIAPAAKILSIRVTLEFNDPLASDQAISQRLPDAIAEGIRYAVNHGARVIDLPLDPGTLGLTSSGDPAAAGGGTAERAAIGYALSRNVVLVAPAGDDGLGHAIVNYPAAYPGVIAVGAIGRSGQLASFSNRRSDASLTAPGVGLVTAAPPDGYGYYSSTSTAGGIVAGVAALILSEFPHLSVAQVTRALIESTAAAAGGAGLPPVPGRSDAGAGYGTVDAVRALEMAALINSAGQPARPAIPASRPRERARLTAASPHRASASTLAGSVLRDAVAAVGVLIVLLVVALIAARARRDRGAAPAPARGRGQHEHRRPDRAPLRSVTPAPDPGTGPDPQSRSQLAWPAPAATNGWASPGGWQGGGIGEIVAPSGASSRPVLAPAPRAATGYRTGRGAGSQADPAGPPWEPAPEPGRMIGPLPVTSASSPPPEPGPGIRVPGDMAVPGAPAASAPAEGAPPAASLSTPPADFDLSTPAFGLTPAAFDFAGPPGPDVPAREDLGFAAAPVATDYVPGPPAEAAQAGDPGPAASADPCYIWDLAASDVFPPAGPGQPAETPGAPDAAPPDAVRPDAGPPDAGPSDAVPADAAPPDAAPPDAGPSDAVPADAARPDAFPPSPDGASGDGGNGTVDPA